MKQIHPSQIPVLLETYNLQWTIRFQEEHLAITSVLPNLFDDIQHFGSTSIPGLVAKDTIDILAGTCAFPWNETYDQLLQSVGFRFYKANHDKWRVYLKPFEEKVRGYHLHVVEYGSRHWDDHLLFRDYLKQHSNQASNYANLKKSLVISSAGKRRVYQKGKNEFVQNIMKQARLWAQSKQGQANA